MAERKEEYNEDKRRDERAEVLTHCTLLANHGHTRDLTALLQNTHLSVRPYKNKPCFTVSFIFYFAFFYLICHEVFSTKNSYSMIYILSYIIINGSSDLTGFSPL